MPKRTQANRLIAINSPLGEDVLLLKGFTLTDELSRPFHCELDLRSENENIKFEDIIGENVTIRVHQTDGKTRYVNGHIASFARDGVPVREGNNKYRATMVPWLWFLTRTSDCRLFLDKTIPEIIQQVFRDYGFSNFSLALSSTYKKREFVVQYRETAFNFVSRLMEEEGIFYFFEHENGKHTLVLADSPSAHEPAPGYEEVPFVQQERDSGGREHFWEWNVEKRLQPARFVHTDFDFTAPAKALLSEKAAPPRPGGGSLPKIVGASPKLFELFDYPGNFTESADGQSSAGVHAQEHDAQYEVARARGDTRGLNVGAKFKLTGYPGVAPASQFVVVSTVTRAETDEFGADRHGQGGGQDHKIHEATYTAIDAAVLFRPARRTPKPRIAGPQTAIVVGVSGEEIDTDKYGRVRVKFHWDRWHPADQTASCWIRVSMGWAGKKWGQFSLPRIGHEVIVEFLEGDPDKPIITGRVYNGVNEVPYKLPDHKTYSTTKSNSSKGGDGFNELRFEDKKGSEQIFMHAQKDEDIRVENDCREWIGHDRHLLVVNDQVEEIQHDRSELVKNDHKEEIKNDRNLKVGGKEAKEVTKSLSLNVKDDVAEKFDKNCSRVVTKDLYIKAENICIEAGTNITIKVGGSSIAIESGSINIKTGDFTVESDKATKIKAGTDCKLEATAGFESKGLTVKIEGTSTADFKGAVTSVKSDGPLTVKGAVTTIN